MNRFQRAREMAGYTQKELAEKIGLKPGIISRYEAESDSAVIPPFSRMQAIADACDLPISFLTDPNLVFSPLNEEQAARFKREIAARKAVLSHWPEETVSNYGTTHPFLYMLKDRWEPTLEDVHYVSKRYGIDSSLILNTVLPSETDLEAKLNEQLNILKQSFKSDENGNVILTIPDFQFIQIETYLYNKGFVVNEIDAKLFEESGIKVIDENNEKHLYLKIDDLDPAVIKALIILVKSNQSSNKKTPQAEQDPSEA